MQPTAMERAEALSLLGFRHRAPPACPASAVLRRVCRERVSKRWSALLRRPSPASGTGAGGASASGRRTGPPVVRYAETEHKAQCFRPLAPAPGELCCEGKLDGTLCPNGARIDLLSREHHKALPRAILPLGLGLWLWLWLWLG